MSAAKQDADSGKILLNAENLCAGYGGVDKPDEDIIHDISFTVCEGERLCIIGPNGCGKTTLLRVLAGTLPYRGSLKVTIQDEASPRYGKETERSSLGTREAARETGFLTQLSSAYFSFTVAETVLLGRYAHQKGGWLMTASKTDHHAVDSALAVCGITEIRDENLGHLSGGQLQRVFLARTIAQDPAVLLLDEPTNHLDLYYQLELLKQLETWIGGGIHASVGVFHDLTLALRFADTMMLLDKGRIAAYGKPAEVVRSEAVNSVYRMDVASSMRELLQNW